MDYKEIQDLIKLVKKNKISELEIEKDDFKISIKSEAENERVVMQTPPPPLPAVQHPVQQAPPAQQNPIFPEQLQPSSEEKDPNLVEIKSPMIGTFYRSPGPDKEPFVSIGDKIEKGKIICMVEAMKLFNEIEAEMSGKVVKILVEDATPVEYDQPLFLIDPKG